MNPIQLLKQTIDQSAQNLSIKEIHLKRNEYLLQAGQIEKYVYFIVEGTLRIYVLQEGEEQIIRFGYTDSFITSLASFLTGNPSEFYLQAIKKCHLQAISKKNLQLFLDNLPNGQLLWQQILEAFVLQQMDREIDLLTNSPMERYQRVLKRSPHLFQEVPHKYIASYLRMTPETLSRLKKS